LKANKSSWHAFVYQYIWSGNLPDNLCPYFWKVMLGLVFVIPVFFLRLLNYILFGVVKLTDKVDEPATNYKDFIAELSYSASCKRSEENALCSLWYILVILVGFVFIAEYNWFKWLFNAYSYDWRIAGSGGLMNTVLAFFILRYFFFQLKDAYQEKYEIKKELKEKHPSILKEFIKAKKEKYCPKIDWE